MCVLTYTHTFHKALVLYVSQILASYDKNTSETGLAMQK